MPSEPLQPFAAKERKERRDELVNPHTVLRWSEAEPEQFVTLNTCVRLPITKRSGASWASGVKQ